MYSLVTGAAGFIGRHLVRRLSANGHRVVGLGHGAVLPYEMERRGLQAWFRGDVKASTLDEMYLAWGPPNSIFHLAGGSSVAQSVLEPRADFQKTVDATADLLEWCRLCAPKATIVMVSSAAVYGPDYELPITELDPCRPCSPYGYHKRMVELLTESYGRSYGLRTAIVRLFSLYGPGLQKQLLWDMCQRLSRAPSVLLLDGEGGEQRDFMSVIDAVTLLIKAEAEASLTPLIINGGTGIGTTIHWMGRRLLDLWGSSAELQFSGNVRVGDPRVLIANTQKIKNDLDFRSEVNLAEGLKDYVTWYHGSERSL